MRAQLLSPLAMAEFVAYGFRATWILLPVAIEAALDGEISWGQLMFFWAYLIRADGGLDPFFGEEQAPYLPDHAA